MSDKKSTSSGELHPALQAFLTSKNGGMEVSNTNIVQHLVQPAISMLEVADRLNPQLKDMQTALNNSEFERLAFVKRYVARNPEFKDKELPRGVSALYTDKTEDLVGLAGSMIKVYFKESKARKYGEEAAEAITTQMKAMATDSAEAAMVKADLANLVKATDSRVANADVVHGVGTKKGGIQRK